MRTDPRRTAFAAVLVPLLLAGCGPGRGAQDLSDETFEAPEGVTDYPPLPLPAEHLNLAARHPTGLTVTIERVAFEPDRIGVQLRMVNPTDKNLTLNKYAKMRLRDDLDNGYDLAAPEHNKNLVILAGHQLDTLLTFKGGFAEQAHALTLVTNDGPGGESNLTDEPKLRVGPVPIQRPVKD